MSRSDTDNWSATRQLLHGFGTVGEQNLDSLIRAATIRQESILKKITKVILACSDEPGGCNNAQPAQTESRAGRKIDRRAGAIEGIQKEYLPWPSEF
jgi:hypothetical protein